MPTEVGSYPGSPSPYGTFDQGGNAYEWNEARSLRGGHFVGPSSYLASSVRGGAGAPIHIPIIGFRLAMVPEPSTGLLVITGLHGVAGRRKARV